MRTALLTGLAFAFGCGYALALIRYYKAINRSDPTRAALWDGVLGLLAMAPFQAWAAAGSSPWVLVGEVLGSMGGTYVALRGPKAQTPRKRRPRPIAGPPRRIP